MILTQFSALLAAHFVGDFVCQTHWQASNKSKRNDALLAHVATYTVVVVFASLLIFGVRPAVIGLALLNGAIHFATDYCTSRLSSRLWAKQKWHDFFVVIGLDQLIHQITFVFLIWAFSLAAV